jgi:methionyl-tRNA formyltransferase
MSKKIVFMGTPEFAVASLRELTDSGINVAAVVTIADKPAGRGQQISESPVKKFAVEKGIPVLQPVSLKDPLFVNALQEINADLFVVVAFRMLPEMVWAMPKLGTINLHGSLLPQYRGAAPINWAVINGETETGATTFFIEKEIDTGKIIDSVKIPIAETDNAGIVHDRMMLEGAKLLTSTVNKIFCGEAHGVPQKEFIQSDLKSAPKIFKEDCKINWNETIEHNYNKIRGLAPYPAAWTEIKNGNQLKTLKLFTTKKRLTGNNQSGLLKVESGELLLGCSNGWLVAEEMQLEGKRKMPVRDFLNGFDPQGWSLVS